MRLFAEGEGDGEVEAEAMITKFAFGFGFVRYNIIISSNPLKSKNDY